MDIELLELRELAKKRELEKKSEWIEPFTDPSVYCLMVFFVVVLAFLLSGCNGSPPATKYAVQRGSFTVSVYPEPNSGNQSVSLHWSFVKERPLGWFVRRTNLFTYESVLIVRDANAYYYHDEYVVPGRYEYKLAAYDEKGEREMGSLFVTVIPIQGGVNE